MLGHDREDKSLRRFHAPSAKSHMRSARIQVNHTISNEFGLIFHFATLRDEEMAHMRAQTRVRPQYTKNWSTVNQSYTNGCLVD